MSTKPAPIPAQYGRLTPYLTVRDAAAAISFYQRVFDAVEIARLPMPGGKIGHAELRLGDRVLMLADECPQAGTASPAAPGSSKVTLLIYVEDADAVTERATAAGATVVSPLENHFYGDRSAVLEDPFGHRWMVATHVEDVSQEEMARRLQAMTPAGQ